MKWFLVDKTDTAQPKTGQYRKWKPILRKEGREQCVYCAIHEGSFGGERNFHVEHHKPQKHFPELTNDIQNLFYSCAICNSFKGSDWPQKADLQYPYPAAVDYSEILFVAADSLVRSDDLAGAYVIERLFLNRPQLVLQRRFLATIAEIRETLNLIQGLITAGAKIEDKLKAEGFALATRAFALMSKTPLLIPYNPADVSRPK